MGRAVFFPFKHIGAIESLCGRGCVFTIRKHNFFSTNNEKEVQKKCQTVVEPFGTLQVVAENANLSLKPTDTSNVSSLKTSLLSFTASEEHLSRIQLSKAASNGIYNLNIFGLPNQKENRVSCIAEVPIKYDLQIHSTGPGLVDIANMESDVVNITSEASHISAKSLKSEEISLVTQSGNVTWKGAILGNVHVITQDGNVQGERIQGLRAHIATESGNIELQSVYSEESRFMSLSGNVKLRNLHRKSVVHIKERGNLTVSGLDGSIEATLNGGHHALQISRLDQSSLIKCEDGSIVLQLPTPCPFSLSIEASDIQLPKDGVEDFVVESNCKVTKPGSDIVLSVSAMNSRVIVQFADWFSSLGLLLKPRAEKVSTLVSIVKTNL